jgi:chitodextrinase
VIAQIQIIFLPKRLASRRFGAVVYLASGQQLTVPSLLRPVEEVVVRKCSYLAVTIMLLHASFGWAQVNVLTQHNDIGRTGANLKETFLNTSNVKVNQFGKLFKRSVDGQIYAQPLYVSNVSIPNQGSHNVLYIATMHNSVYAFDADNPNASTPLWQRNLGPSVPQTDVGDGDIKIEIGITSTPVIDLSSHTLYCVAKTKENTSYFQRLHELDITTGQPKSGSPVVITASASGSGDASVNGKISFNPLRQLNRPALLLLNGVIYLAFGSHGDLSPYHAWVLSYNATTLQQMAIFNGTSNGSRGGIWQGGQGLVADANGYIYLMTGNGTFDYNTGGPDLGMSFIKLTTPGLDVADWFTPYNVDSLNSGNLDLGGSGPLLIPGTNLVLGGGKEGVFHLLNRNSMGHFHAGGNSQIVQNFKATAGHIHGSPIYWNGPNGPMIYVWSEQDKLKQFKFANGLLQTTPVATSTMYVPNGVPGAMLSLSANGSAAGSGIVWASHPYDADANPATVAGIFRAFDASNVSVELWNSKQNAARDDVGNFAKFCPATVANGKVYLATFSNQLVVYGRLNVLSGDTQAPNSPTGLAVSATTSTSVSLAWTASTDNVGVAGYQVYRDSSQVGTSATTKFTNTGLAPAINYSYSVKAYDSAGNVSGPSNVVNATTKAASSAGLLSGGIGVPASLINLSSAGTTDWAHWGLSSTTSFDHKRAVTQSISNYTRLGTGSIWRVGDNLTAFSWSDGTPTASATATKTGILALGVSNGFQITGPADTTQRTLKVHVGVWTGQGKFEVRLSDGSAPSYTDTSLVNTTGARTGVYTLVYSAASSGRTLTIKYTLLNSYSSNGNVTLEAATLATGP